ncbi:MAG: Coenzyme F420 hydrogenase/dehydrogenase, beta subunit C-terminal domain [Anaerolineae bacterium]
MSKRLQQEVWNLGQCSGCGACVTACAKGVLVWGADQHPVVQSREKRLGLSRLKLRACEACDHPCEEACPRLAGQPSAPLRFAVAARAKGPLAGCTTDDCLRALLVSALQAGLIDGALAYTQDPWTMQPLPYLATTPAEAADCRGPQALWSPVLDQLNEAVFRHRLARLAVVGTPCVAQGVARLRGSSGYRYAPYRQALRLMIATFCTAICDPELVGHLLREEAGLEAWQVRRFTSVEGEDNLQIDLIDGSQRTVPLHRAQQFTRRGCAYCSDYAGTAADLALGSVGAAEGWSSLLVRTALGEAVLRQAEALGLIETSNAVDGQAIDAAQQAKERRERARSLAGLRLELALAAAGAGERGKANRLWTEMLAVRQQPQAEKEGDDGDCGGCAGCAC